MSDRGEDTRSYDEMAAWQSGYNKCRQDMVEIVALVQGRPPSFSSVVDQQSENQRMKEAIREMCKRCLRYGLSRCQHIGIDRTEECPLLEWKK